jgi:predicted DNA-binding protein YlxM (UPF0122 family)
MCTTNIEDVYTQLEIWHRMLSTKNKRVLDILKYRVYDGMSMDEIGKMCNISKQRVSQILFDEWEAEVRYCKAETEPIKSHLTIKKVEAFFNGASEIFNACKSFHPESKSSKI